MEASDKPTAPAAAAQPTPPVASPPPAPASAPAKQEDDVERYGVDGWKERDRMLGVSPHAIAGALHGLEGDAKLTEQEVHDRLEKFLKRPGTEQQEDES